MKLVLIGIQGAGKSTQGNLLSDQLKIPYLSTGHIFRDIAKERTKLGRYVKELINAGTLIPDDRTIEIVNSYLSRPEYKYGYILDGFPRTVAQAEQFKNNIFKAIHIKIPDKEALWRLAYREDQRDDDTIRAILKRINIFHTHTEPVIEYYRNQEKLVTVSGLGSIEDINQEILKNLGKQLVSNHVKNWKKKRKSIVVPIGMPGSGKSEASNFFRDKGYQVISFSNVINDYVDNHKLEHNEEIHSMLRKQFRKEHGMEAMAKLNHDMLQEALNKNSFVAIEGLRSWEEYEYIRNQFSEADIFLIGLYVPKDMRYKRIQSRSSRSNLYGEKRDIQELMNTNMGPTIAFADYMIDNSGPLNNLLYELEQIYRVIRFT